MIAVHPRVQAQSRSRPEGLIGLAAWQVRCLFIDVGLLCIEEISTQHNHIRGDLKNWLITCTNNEFGDTIA